MQSPDSAPDGAVRVLRHVHGRRVRRLSAAAFPNVVFGLHAPLGERHQPALQRGGHSQRRISLHQRRAHGLAADMGGYFGHPAGSVSGGDHPRAVAARRQEFQIICGSGAAVRRRAHAARRAPGRALRLRPRRRGALSGEGSGFPRAPRRKRRESARGPRAAMESAPGDI